MTSTIVNGVTEFRDKTLKNIYFFLISIEIVNLLLKIKNFSVS